MTQFLIVHDKKTHKTDVQDLGQNGAKAENAYLEKMTRLAHEKNFAISLIEAADMDALKKNWPRYFIQSKEGKG